MQFFTHEICINGKKAPLRAYLPDAAPSANDRQRRPAVIVFPGGSYLFTYEGEAEPIALRYLAEGVCAFVLDYSVYPARFPQALLEGLEAIRFVREHAEEYGIDPKNIAVCGFSAGGHLAACTGTLWNHAILDGLLSGDRRAYRPDKLILCYPVVDFSHKDSFMNLVERNEEELTPERIDLLSPRKQITADTPPTFLWHNADDGAVSAKGSLQFATALYDGGVPFQIRVYGKGNHGCCSADHVTVDTDYASPYPCAAWMKDSLDFLFGKE